MMLLSDEMPSSRLSTTATEVRATAIATNRDGTESAEICQTPSGEFASSQSDAKYRIDTPSLTNARHRLKNIIPLDENTLRQKMLETQLVIETRAAAKKALP